MKKNVLIPLVNSLLIPLGLTVIHVRILGFGTSGSGTTTWIMSNEDMKDIIKIVKSFKDSDLLIKGVTQTV